MAKYQITSPSGETFEVTAPDNATEAQVLAFARQRMAPKGRVPDALDNPNMATEGMSTTARTLAGISSGLRDVWGGVTFAPKSEVDARRAIEGPLRNTTAGTVGNVLGNIAGSAPAMLIPGANTVQGATIIGMGVGGLTTPGDIGERGTGALLGGAGGFLGQMIPRTVSTLKAAAEPFTEAGRNAIIGRTLNRVTGNSSRDVAGRLRGASELVPGSAPTAAEVGESGGLAALQRAMQSADTDAYTQRGMQQASARVNALREIAGDEGQRQFFDASRRTTAKSLYDEAYAKGVDLKRDAVTGQFLTKAQQSGRMGEITKLMRTPAMQEAAESAKKLMLNDPNLRGKVLDPAGSVQGLDYTRRALSDNIKRTLPGSNEQRVLISLRDRLDTTLDTISPKYAEARTTFREMSRPINQMDVGKALLDKMQPALADHGALASETGESFARALRNEGEAVARNATKFRQGINDVLTPEQMASVNAIAQDLARKSNAQNLGRGPGSNTFQNFAMDNLSAQMGMPSAVSGLLGVIPGGSPSMTLLTSAAGAAGKAALSSKEQVIRAEMARALLNPQTAAALMDAAAQPSGLSGLLMRSPQALQRAIPPDEALRILQATPGLLGTVGLPAYLQQK
jgi:hypothetical protein